MKKFLSVLLCIVILISMSGCGDKKEEETYKPIQGLNADEQISLKIATAFETDKALDLVINKFTEKYPNVHIQLEYVEDYDNNALEMMKNDTVDIIFQRDVIYKDTSAEENTETEEEPWTTEDFFYDFKQDKEIDLSNTTSKLMGNYTHTRKDASGEEITYQYAIPIGGEVRGLYVNKTFLKSLGLEVPNNWNEFLDCCEKVKNAGYVPIQGNAGTAAMAIMLAHSVNDVVHDEDSLEKMRSASNGVSELFEDSISDMYYLATNRYYDYKYVEEELGMFKGAQDIAQARDFLGLVRNDATYEYTAPENNYGTVAFFPYLSYVGSMIDDLIDEYKLDTEVEFIATPTSTDGNNPVYLTPYYGICANKNSENLDWIREFVNFFFQTDMNKLYAENAGIIPNTEDAISYMADKYGVDEETDCASCGDIYFSNEYNGYTPLAKVLVDVSKCGAQKYMVPLNKDENGNIQYLTDENGKEYVMTEGDKKVYKEFIGEEDSNKPGYAFCNKEYYMDELETAFVKYRE